MEFGVLGEISLPRTLCGGGCRFWFWFQLLGVDFRFWVVSVLWFC